MAGGWPEQGQDSGGEGAGERLKAALPPPTTPQAQTLPAWQGFLPPSRGSWPDPDRTSHPTKHLPRQSHPRRLPLPLALPIPWLGCWWTVARPGPSPGAGPDGQHAFTAASTRPGREWGGQWAPQLPPSPTEGPPWLLPRPLGWRPPRPADSSCCPRTQPQAHLLPSRPLFARPTPDLLGAFSLLPAQHDTALLAGMPPVQADSPTVLHVRLPTQDGTEGGWFGGTLPHGWRVWGCASEWALLVHLGTRLSRELLQWWQAPGCPPPPPGPMMEASPTRRTVLGSLVWIPLKAVGRARLISPVRVGFPPLGAGGLGAGPRGEREAWTGLAPIPLR